MKTFQDYLVEATGLYFTKNDIPKKYRGVSVKIKHHSEIDDGYKDFFGLWEIINGGKSFEIYVDKDMVEELEKKQIQRRLILPTMRNLLDHEFREATLGIKNAKKAGFDLSKVQKNKHGRYESALQNIFGSAHDETIKDNPQDDIHERKLLNFLGRRY